MTNKFASLYAGLLARKGDATPVFTNPAVSYVDGPRPADGEEAEMIRRNVASADGLPLMAEKAMGADDPAAALTPGMAGAVVHTHAHANNGARAHLRAVKTAPPKKRARKLNGDHQGPYRFSFRMPADQHRRLRVAAAQKNISQQQALEQALENYLDGLCACSLKECNCLAPQGGKASPQGGKAN
jgi:hypothetical protein